jgi:hypothetical protein
MHETLEDLQARLDTLERANRRLKKRADLSLGLSLLFMVGLLSTVAAPRSRSVAWDRVNVKSLVAEEITVRKDGFKTEGMFCVNPEGRPSFALFDEAKRCRSDMILDELGRPRLDFYGENCKQTLVLYNSEDGFPGLSMYDSEGRQRAALGVGKGRSTGKIASALYFCGAAERRVLEIGSTPGDWPVLYMKDSRGKDRIGIFIGAKENACVSVSGGPAGRRNVAMVAEANADPAFLHFEDGRRVPMPELPGPLR